MYTPFEGNAFFGHYFYSRRICRETLEPIAFRSRVSDEFEKKILDLGMEELTDFLRKCEPSIRTRLESLKPVAVMQEQKERLNCSGQTARATWDAEHRGLEDIGEKENIKTLPLVKNLLVALASRNDQKMKDAKIWIDKLVQKFEVTKKIFTAYPSISGKGLGAYDHMIVYAFLAFLLALYYGRTENLKYLNTVIKLNDLLCSVKDKVKTDIAASTACYLSLLFESMYVRELMLRKGLKRCISMT